MADRKPLALGILVWAALSTVVQADPIGSPNQFNWVAYFAGQPGSCPCPQPAPAPTPVPAAPPAAVSTQLQAPQIQVSAPAPSPSVSVLANAPVSQPQSSAPAPSPSSAPVDAFINLGNGPYPLQNTITTGNAGAWYNSSQITSLFGGQPTAQQIQSFDSAVLQRIQQTFSLSGVGVTLTDNPNVAALHTLSLVSNTSSANLELGNRHDAGRGQRFQLHRQDRSVGPVHRSTRVDRRTQYFSRVDAGVRGPRKLRPVGPVHRFHGGELGDDGEPQRDIQPGRGSGDQPGTGRTGHHDVGAQLGAQLISADSVPEPATFVLWTAAGGPHRGTAAIPPEPHRKDARPTCLITAS